MEGEDLHQAGQEQGVAGRIAQIRHWMLQHLLRMGGIALLEQVEAEGADRIGRIALALGQLAGARCADSIASCVEKPSNRFKLKNMASAANPRITLARKRRVAPMPDSIERINPWTCS